jgi:dUTP pyrophosphatase
MTVKVKYHADITPLNFINGVSDWIDLRCAETVRMQKGEYYELSLGVSMELPPGYEAVVIPRSSTYKRWGILQANQVGLIDNSYCGDNDIWHFPAIATRDVVIEENSRICQFRIQRKMEDVELVTVDHLDGADRGGLGSTGKA